MAGFPARNILLIAALALVNIFPMILNNISGDIDFHLVLIECFSRQFWQGDIYPRWCFDANAGLGSPLPLFYFPLPYYVAALLYPLSHLGVSIYGIYILSLLLATIVTVLTCYLWLKDIVSPGRALLAGLLFIFLPYRMEAMFFRSAYAEAWGIALLPLIFKYVRRLEILPLMAVFGLLLITHVPTAAVAAAGSGMYVLVMSGKKWEPKWRYAAGLSGGGALAAFYLVPIIYYKQFLAKAPLFVLTPRSRGWPNTYLTMHNVHYQTPVVLLIMLILFALVALSFYVIRRRLHIEDGMVRRETVAWGIISVVALFLLFPVSAPFYALIGPLSQVVFPWRMQLLFMLALAFFAAVWMQWFAGERRMKTWKGDFSILLAFLILLSYSVAASRDPQDFTIIAKAHIMTSPEYRTMWTDAEHYGEDYLSARYARNNTIHAADIISGKGNIMVEHWAWDGIILKAQSTHGVTVRLNQFYFPVWSAHADDEEPVTLRPEPETGKMLLDIPAGRHRIRLHYAISTGKLWLRLSGAVSALAALVWLWAQYRRRS